MTTKEIDVMAEKLMREHGATPSFLNYRGYPATVCTSVNDEVVHAIPGKRRLKGGDRFANRHAAQDRHRSVCSP